MTIDHQLILPSAYHVAALAAAVTFGWVFGRRCAAWVACVLFGPEESP